MVEHYNLDAIISVGYRVKSKRSIEFRRWANCVFALTIMVAESNPEEKEMMISVIMNCIK